MTLTFPNSPAVNDTFIYKDKVYKYDGKKWVSGFLNNSAISTEYIDYNNITPTPEINLDLRKYNFFELNLGTSPNLFSYPEDFTKNPPWFTNTSNLNGTLVNGQTVLTPDYTQNANKITENTTANAIRYFYALYSFTKDVTYTISIYVKRNVGTRNFGIVLPSIMFGVFIGATYNLTDGTYTLSAPAGSVNASANITNEGDGWYRCSITATAVSTTISTNIIFSQIQFRLVNNSDLYGTYTGDGTSSIYIWGAKLEVGKLTSYIPPEITNKLKYSEQFSDSVWTKLNTNINANILSAPDGTLTGDLLLETVASGQHSVSYSSSAITPSITDLRNRNYTLSIYVKKYNRSRFFIKMAENTNTSYIAAFVDLDAVTATLATSVGSGVAVGCSITPSIDGWYRISLTGRTGENSVHSLQFIILDDTGSLSYVGDTTKGIYIWGAQLQKGALTSYQKTDALAYYNVNLTESSESDMFLLKIKNQIKPDFNLDLTTTSAMPYDNYVLIYPTVSNAASSLTNIGLFVSPDGSKIYSAASSYSNSGSLYYNYIFQNNLSTPWDITSTFLSQGQVRQNAILSLDSLSTAITGIYISNDGTNLYVSRLGTTGNIFHYALSTPWNLSTSTLIGTYSITQASNVLNGITFKPDGTSMYILGGTTDAIYEYNLSSPWNLATATYTAGNTISVSDITTEPYSLQFSPDGTKLFFVSTNNTRLYQLDLSTAWKINTVVNNTVGNSKYVSIATAVAGNSFTISPDGLKTFILRNGFNVNLSYIYQYASSYLGSLDYTISWPNNIKWENGSPPSITKSNQNTLIEFYKYNGIWNAKLLVDDI